jgi:hypothetical protein
MIPAPFSKPLAPLAATWLIVAALFFAAQSSALAKTIRVPLADGFDHAVGKPDAVGYYKFRGFTPNGHLGEDWNGRGGGDSDLGDPITAIGDGVVVFSENYRAGWGNVVIVRHAYRDTAGKLQMVDSLYGHLHERKVQLYDIVKRGQLVGTMGGNNGMYAVHLHLEVHKNLRLGMFRSSYSRGFENYHRPTDFINANRTCSSGALSRVEVPVDTFTKDSSAPSVTLSSRPSLPSYRTGTGGLSIPVYRGSGTSAVKPSVSASPPSSKKLSPIESINLEAKARARMPATPAPKPTVRIVTTPSNPTPSSTKPAPSSTTENSGGSFWSRLKSKMKSGTQAGSTAPSPFSR